MKKQGITPHASIFLKVIKKIKLRTWIALGIVLVLTPILLFSLFKPQSGEAAWFNDSWTYRTTLSFTHNANISDTKVKFDIATDALITAGKMQSDCGDSRFTDANGKELLYFIDTAGGACNTNSTDYYVLIPSIINGSNVIYHYYGNPTIVNGTQSVQFTQATTSPSGGAASTGSEEKTNGPVIYYKMDEGNDNTCSGGTNDVCDSRGTTTDGAISSGTAWKNEDFCLSGKCLFFDGSDDVVTTTQTSRINLSAQLSAGFTFEAWIKPNGAGEGTGGQIFQKGANSWLRVDTLSGNTLDIEASVDLATTDATLNVAAAINNNQWNHIALTYTDDGDDELTIWVNGRAVGTSTNGVGSLASDSNNLLIGGTTTNNFQGFIDEFKIYNYEHSVAQMATDSVINATSDGSAAVFGQNNNPALNSGLVGYWTLNEASGNAADSSGNATTLTNSATTPYLGAKFGNGADFESGSSQYESVADNATLSITGSLTLSAWIKPETVSAGSYNIIAKWDGANESYRLFQNGDEIRIELDSAGNYVETTSSNLATGTWYHVAGVYNATTATAKVYINGTEATSTTTGTIPSSIGNDAGKFHIGAEDSTGGAANFYDGVIDEARVYSRALSGGEIQQLYNWAAGPVAYWKIDENTGQNIYDLSGNANTATVGGSTSVEAVDPKWIPGKYGSALNFDGVDDYAEVPQSASTNLGTLTDNYTIEAWAYYNNSAGGWVLEKGQALFGDGNVSYTLSANASMQVAFALFDGTNPSGAGQTAAQTITPGVWYHLTGVRDAAADKVRLYINGVLSDEQTDAVTGTVVSTTEMAFANNGGGHTEPTAGKVDEVKLYNYARTASQIIEDMNGGHPLGGSPIGSQVINWHFDEGQGTTANNAISGGTNGTLTNMDTAPSVASSGWTFTGKENKALVFNGSDDRVSIATASDGNVDFSGTEQFSVCSFVFPTTMAGSAERDLIVGKWDATTPTRGYRLTLTNDDADTTGNFRAEVYDESTDQTISASGSNDTVSLNTWYHVCMTFNGGIAGAAGDLHLYVNAYDVANNSANASFLGLEDVTADFTVGDYDATDAVAADTGFTGRIDEVQVYAGLLSSDQVKVVMNGNGAINFGSTTTSEATQITGTAETPPLVYLPFDENTGTTARDVSANARDGTLSTGTSGGLTKWINGKIGSAVYMNPVDAADTLPAFYGSVFLPNDTFDSLTAGTIEFWFKADDNTEDQFQEMFFGGNANAGTDHALEIGFDTTNDQVWLFFTDTATRIDAHTPTISTPTGWHHVVFTNTVGANRLYLDGQLQTLTYATGSSSTDFFFDNVSTGTTYYHLGCTVSGATACAQTENYWGAIDNLKVYDYVRTQAQVAYDYNRGAPIGWWKFDECSGTTAFDASGIGNNATLTYGGGTYTQAGTCTSGTASDGWFGGAVGKFNSSLALDTTTDTISVGNIGIYSFERTSPFSTSIWFKTSTDGSMTLISKQDSSAPFSGWNVQSGAGGFLYLQLVNTYSSNTLEVHTSNVTYSNGNWHNVVTTYDGSSTPAGVHIYYDGRDQALTTTVDSPLSATIVNSIPVYIGSRNGTAQKFDGQLDDARLYNYALTLSQVKKVYNEGASARFGPLTGTPLP